MKRKATGIAQILALTGVLVGAGLVVIPRLILTRLQTEAHRADIQVQVKAVSLGWRSIWLHGVKATSPSFPGQAVEIKKVRIGLSARLIATKLEGEGGSLQLTGNFEGVRSRFNQWRQRSRAGKHRHFIPVELRNATVAWKGDGGDSAKAENVRMRFRRGPGEIAHFLPAQDPTVSIRDESRATQFELNAGSATIQHNALASGEVRTKSITLSGYVNAGALDLQLSVGEKIVATLRTKMEHDNRHVIATIPRAPCQQLLEAIPEGLLGQTSSIKVGGEIELRMDVGPDSKHVDMEVDQTCRVLESSVPDELSVARLRKSFRRFVYSPSKELVVVESGPGSSNWVNLPDVSPYMEKTLQITEDLRFRQHSGFEITSIRDAVRDDIAAGKFQRGASTLTMQLAKNLWLTREKTVARKIQETILTTYLEQSMTKDEILELYLNVAEFGPSLYGIGPASEHYFHRHPRDLSLSQALYLATLLPNPRDQHLAPSGTISQGHMEYLRSIMKRMRDAGIIIDADYRAGIIERIDLQGGTAVPAGRAGATFLGAKRLLN